MITSIRKNLLIVCAFVVVLSVNQSLLAQSSNLNKRAQALAKTITPRTPAKKADPNGLAASEKQMIRALEIMEESYRTSGPNPPDLISKALEFREDIGSIEGIVLADTLLDTWRAANSMGLFHENGKFGVVIKKGRGVGEKVIFELIIPADLYPPASNQLANLRLVPFAEKRVADAPLTAGERATGSQLKSLVEERIESMEVAAFRKGPAVNQLGQTEDEQLRLWKAAMEGAGEIAHQKPNLRIKAKMTASPSHMTKDRWRLSTEFTNSSTHPTEITVEIWMIGYTEKKRKYFVMTHHRRDLKLRSGEIRSFDIFSKSRSSYKNRADDIDGLSKKERKGTNARYRGFMIQASHATGIVEYYTTDARLDKYLDPKEEKFSVKDLPKL